jgi:predicted nucleic acid-binding protein
VTLVDSNIVIDILSSNPAWKDRSALKLAECVAQGDVYFNEIIYAELAVRSSSEAELDDALRDLGLRLGAMPLGAYFLAGKAFERYRDAGGPRTSLLPDFFIGAHAEILGLPILTRDTRRYHVYFPAVTLIEP